MATFQQLQDRVSDELIDVPQRTANQIGNWINRAIRRAQDRHDFAVCRTITAVLTTAPDTRILAAVPANFLRFRRRPFVIDNQGNVIELGVATERGGVERVFMSVDGGEFIQESVEGHPAIILLAEPLDELGARNFEIYPLSDGRSLYTGAPVGEYRIRVPYVRRLADLSAAGDQNWFTNNAEEFIAQQAVSYGFFFNHDSQKGGIWAQRALSEIQDVVARDKNEAVSGEDTLHISPDVLDARVPPGDARISRLIGRVF